MKHLFEKVEKMHDDVAGAAPIETRLVGGGSWAWRASPPLPKVHPWNRHLRFQR